jgi:23S rRNA (guanosine2251-2'-O)-methyltransferase
VVEGEGSARWIYGIHAVKAALANQHRTKRRLLLTQEMADKGGFDGGPSAEIVPADTLNQLVPRDAAHQGVALLCEDLTATPLPVLASTPQPGRPIVVCDHITDPVNVGAIFRSAAAFGARGVVLQERRAPPLTGPLAKAAAGGVDMLPHARETNIARALDTLKAAGYTAIGLAGTGETALCEVAADRAVALVLGAEGEGLRRLVAEHCDILARIPIAAKIDSLNVAATAAIALHRFGKV